MKHELNNPLKETRTNTFTHDNVVYDLDYVRKAARQLPRQLVKVDDLKWLLEECDWTTEDEKRYAYLGRPIFVVNWKGKVVVVDGYHRLHRAVRKNLKHLSAIYIPNDIMERAKV